MRKVRIIAQNVSGKLRQKLEKKNDIWKKDLKFASIAVCA